jgi:hypothetical protein
MTAFVILTVVVILTVLVILTAFVILSGAKDQRYLELSLQGVRRCESFSPGL